MSYSKSKTISGIYLIRQLSTGRVYVGGSAHILHRWGNHRTKLNSGVHENPRLQQAWNETGSSDFEFSIAQESPKDQLIAIETEWINALGAYSPDRGFNIYPPDNAAHPALSAEHRRKLSVAGKGREVTPEHRRHLSEALIGRPKSAQAVENNRRAHIGLSRGIDGSSAAVLTEKSVASIKRALAAGGSPIALAREYGVSESAIRHILHGHDWAYVLPDLDVYSQWKTHRSHR